MCHASQSLEKLLYMEKFSGHQTTKPGNESTKRCLETWIIFFFNFKIVWSYCRTLFFNYFYNYLLSNNVETRISSTTVRARKDLEKQNWWIINFLCFPHPMLKKHVLIENLLGHWTTKCWNGTAKRFCFELQLDFLGIVIILSMTLTACFSII